MVGASGEWFAWRGLLDERAKVVFTEGVGSVLLGGRGVDTARAFVPEDGRVHLVRETGIAAVGVGADPVVADCLIGIEDKRITLA